MIELNLIKTLNTPNGKMELNINLSIPKGGITTFYGESGAGKTSTFRMIAGLLSPNNGNIVVDGDIWLNTSKKIILKPQERNIGFAFQDNALFPNMTVRENLEFALKKHQTKKEVDDLLQEMGLGELQHKKTETLSGGQKQRVGLARALVQKPNILLLDEPLSALDNDMRVKLQDYILAFHKKTKCTILLISHDIGEIQKLSNTVCILKNGHLIKTGTPYEVFQQPLEKKTQLEGKINHILKKEDMGILSINIGSNLLAVRVKESDLKNYKVGDKILVNSKIMDIQKKL